LLQRKHVQCSSAKCVISFVFSHAKLWYVETKKAASTPLPPRSPWHRHHDMDQDVEIPDVRFWGLIVPSGKPATYSIDNEHGLLELCHLTNVALVSESSRERPVYVRIRSPGDENEFTLGALIPGKIYSFSTDLMISPDTQFTHSGGPRDQVHLTGYRCDLIYSP
jgi:hypothetical protein